MINAFYFTLFIHGSFNEVDIEIKALMKCSHEHLIPSHAFA